MAHKVTDECVACGACVDTCPVGAISLEDKAVVDASACVDCGACEGACPLVQSSRNNHSVPNPLCSVCCAGDFLMQKFIDGLIQALYPAAELFLLLWYRAFALFYTLYGTLTHFTERLQGTAKNVQFFTQTIRQHGRYRLNSAVQ